MDQDSLQWLWDGVDDFQTKFNDLRSRAMRNFQRPFDSCSQGVLTFGEARFVKEKLTGGCAVPNPKDRDFKAVPATAC